VCRESRIAGIAASSVPLFVSTSSTAQSNVNTMRDSRACADGFGEFQCVMGHWRFRCGCLNVPQGYDVIAIGACVCTGRPRVFAFAFVFFEGLAVVERELYTNLILTTAAAGIVTVSHASASSQCARASV
jgi:hypothetical protein